MSQCLCMLFLKQLPVLVSCFHSKSREWPQEVAGVTGKRNMMELKLLYE